MESGRISTYSNEKIEGISQKQGIFHELIGADFNKIKQQATARQYKKDDLIFAEGDAADYIYFIESGQISIFIQKFTSRDEISILVPGEYFGEMAFFNKDKRSASAIALTDTSLLSIDKNAFQELLKTDRTIADKINTILATRNAELVLKETLLDSAGVKGRNLHISIKGDPSIRESVFSRERYESVVDKILPQLVPRLQDLLLNRCVYEFFMHFNSGEVRVASIFNPFNEEIHPASKLADEAYVDRHFPEIVYARKAEMVKRLYGAIASDPCFINLPEHYKNVFSGQYKDWEPINPVDISHTLSKLPDLRKIPDFYLRNFAISITQDAIRMQFNCDGTHIVSAADYQHFLEENLIAEEVPENS